MSLRGGGIWFDCRMLGRSCMFIGPDVGDLAVGVRGVVFSHIEFVRSSAQRLYQPLFILTLEIIASLRVVIISYRVLDV